MNIPIQIVVPSLTKASRRAAPNAGCQTLADPNGKVCASLGQSTHSVIERLAAG